MKKMILLAALVLFGLSGCVDKTVNVKPLKVVCLGDSITYGFTLPIPGKQSYPARLKERARGRWNVVNYGKNGATVLKKGDIPIVLQDVYQGTLRSRPDVVVLLLGTNDIKDANWRYKNEFIGDYVALVQTLKDLPSNPRVIACLIPPIVIDYPNGLTAKRVQEANGLLKEAIAESGAESVDLYSLLLRLPEYFTDGVHPNTRGAQAIASLLFEQISATDAR